MKASEMFCPLPPELTSAMRWIVWKKVVRKGKTDKPPYDFRTGQPGDVTDPAVWSTYTRAVEEASSGKFDGIGYVFTPADRITGVDLDHSLDGEGKPYDWAERIVLGFDSYTEVSPSGRGLHIFVKGSLPDKSRHKVGGFGPDGSGAVEVYDRGRYFTVTSRHFAGSPRSINDRQEELEAFYREWFPPAETTGEEAGARPNDCDDEFVLRMARTSKGHERFCRLYDDGEITGFGSQSDADLSLCSSLAFWTGGNAAAVDRLFRQSALMRDKWDRSAGAMTYGERTVAKSLSGHTSFFDAGGEAEDTPAEEASVDAGATDWEAPILDESVPAMPFPIDVFPPELGFFIYEGATCLTCPPDYLAVTALAVAGSAIGRSLAVRLKNTWSECPTIFAALVGRPGTTKSPALSLMTRPLWKIAEEYLAQYKRDLERHKQEQGRDGAIESPAPTLQRIAVNDTTCEALAPILAENPHGLVMVRDELTAWVAGLNQYKSGGKGSDRQFFLSTWSGSPVVVDRKADREKGPISIPHPFLGVVGGLTPDMLGELSDSHGRDDGFIDRLLFTFPEPTKIRWNAGAVSSESIDGWLRVVRQLRSRPMVGDEDDQVRPFFVDFEPDALAVYAEWFNANQEETEQDDFPRHLDGAWSKMRAYCGRFALIIDQLHRAYDPTDDGEELTIRLSSVRKALKLTDYFRNHCRRVRALLRGATGENPDARAVLKWIVHTDRREFSERDVRHNFPGRFGGSDADLGHALAWLKGRNCIRPIVAEKKPPSKGRPASQRFEVNPALPDAINGVSGISGKYQKHPDGEE